VCRPRDTRGLKEGRRAGERVQRRACQASLVDSPATSLREEAKQTRRVTRDPARIPHCYTVPCTRRCLGRLRPPHRPPPAVFGLNTHLNVFGPVPALANASSDTASTYSDDLAHAYKRARAAAAHAVVVGHVQRRARELVHTPRAAVPLHGKRDGPPARKRPLRRQNRVRRRRALHLLAARPLRRRDRRRGRGRAYCLTLLLGTQASALLHEGSCGLMTLRSTALRFRSVVCRTYLCATRSRVF
jgi:hypothetical protein